MESTQIELAHRVVLGAALAFLVVLFLPWQEATVRVAGVVDLEERSSGWSGWGLAAGLVALVLLALQLGRLRARDRAGHTGDLASALLAAALVAAAALAVFTGETSVATQAVGVEVGSTLWPAWLGLALAAVAAAASLVPLAEAREHGHGVRASRLGA